MDTSPSGSLHKSCVLTGIPPSDSFRKGWFTNPWSGATTIEIFSLLDSKVLPALPGKIARRYRAIELFESTSMLVSVTETDSPSSTSFVNISFPSRYKTAVQASLALKDNGIPSTGIASPDFKIRLRFRSLERRKVSSPSCDSSKLSTRYSGCLSGLI